LGSKLMVRSSWFGGDPVHQRKGSFTLVSGILNDDPIFSGVSGSTVLWRFESFCSGAAI